MNFTRRATTAGLLSLAAASSALAQARRTVTIVVPFPPGGSVDALARLLQGGLQERLGADVSAAACAGLALLSTRTSERHSSHACRTQS